MNFEDNITIVSTDRRDTIEIQVIFFRVVTCVLRWRKYNAIISIIKTIIDTTTFLMLPSNSKDATIAAVKAINKTSA